MSSHILTTEEAVAWLWRMKATNGAMFMHAETLHDEVFDPGNSKYTRPAGTRVLVTLISRFGHVCLRCTDVDDIGHGYDLGLQPERLTNWRIVRQQGAV